MKVWMLAVLLLLTWGVRAQPADIESFSRDDQYRMVKISPGGGHLAILTPVEGKNVLAILNSETMKPTYVARFPGNKQVGDFHWANDERVIVQLEFFKGWFQHPVSAGEWYAVNVDGSLARNIFGYRAGAMQTGSRIKKATATYGYGQVVDLLKDDNDEILISSTPYDSRGQITPDSKAELLRLNVYSGLTRKVTRAPVGSAQFLTDHNGQPRFVLGISSTGLVQIHQRDLENRDWQLFYENDQAGWNIAPLAFANEHQVYLAASDSADVTGIYKLDLNSGKRELVFRDKAVDPNAFYFSADRRHLYALEVTPDYPEYVFVDADRPESKLLKGLLQAFEGSQVRLISQTEKGDKAVVYVFNDRNPGSYYLYDSVKGAVSFLMNRRPWVDPAQSAEVKPIQFQARDGLTIHGYLTLPPGQEAKNLPLVVNPHGGPHGPRDFWEYNQETQLLASRGIAVLQVNFRGSGGYGNAFEAAGYREWGRAIQHDIIDGTRYLVEQGIADKGRICLYGASFGGYSALQSAILEPDLYACAIGFVGIYDLPLMFDEGDVQEHKYGMRYLNKVLGEDEAQLKAFSPVYQVDKLKTPVMLIHGEEDERAPIEHAERLKSALEAKQHPLQWMVMDKEGHGFYGEENRAEMYEAMLGFLDTHLKL